MRIPGAAPQPAPPGRNPGFWGAPETPTSRRFLHGLKWVVVSPGGSQLGDKAKPHAPSPGTNSIKKKWGCQLHPNLWWFVRYYLIVGVSETAEEEAAFP